MKRILLAIGVVLATVAGIAYLYRNAIWPPAPVRAPDAKNISYNIDGKEIRLVNGNAAATVYFGNEVRGDFDSNGTEDVAFLLAQSPGGSGTFFYVVAALKTANGYIGTNGVLLGDRISPQSSEFSNGVITINYADRKAGEPMTAAPSVGASLRLKVENGMLREI